MLLTDPSWRESRQADGYYARPELDEALTFYLHAWFDLSSDRREALAQISYSAIALYADRTGHEGVDDFDRFHGLMRALDGEYLDVTNRKLNRDMPRGKH